MRAGNGMLRRNDSRKSRWLMLALALLAPCFIAGKAFCQKESKAEFQTSDRCLACHNGLTTPSGKDVSIGFDWRSSIMANSARDPYWQASVRREDIDHPESRAAIEDGCADCHMPISRYEAKVQGHLGQVFAHLPFDDNPKKNASAEDGVSFWVFHHIMKTSTGVFRPTEAAHIHDSALCATCHTLYTTSLAPDGKEIGKFPEQVPFLEWQHSDYPQKKSCQSCHMPEVEGDAPIAAVLGELRQGVRQHTFIGANFFILSLLNSHRNELSVSAMPAELTAEADRTKEFLQTQAARVTIRNVELSGDHLNADVVVENLTGHKLPTAFPSRRAWLHFVVRDADGKTVFESGALNANGSIQGNDNDADASRFEPHYREITSSDQVQIYEPILKNQAGEVTTGLAAATGYLKDNRLLPSGFQKQNAEADIAVVGDAAEDPNFTDRGDQVRYSAPVAGGHAPFHVEVELWYQPIGYRWAHNLNPYSASETRRFVSYYDSMPSSSAIVLARSEANR